MKTTPTKLNGVLIIEPKVIEDHRGYFFESYNKQKLENLGIKANFVQDNQSKSEYGVLRGLHYQIPPKPQAKLIRVLDGRIFDVAVDLRKSSPTFGKWFGTELSSANKKQLFIPRGFAHGFSVLSPTAVVMYKCDNFYAPDTERGIRFDDKTLNINWQIDHKDIKISERDSNLLDFEHAEMNF